MPKVKSFQHGAPGGNDLTLGIGGSFAVVVRRQQYRRCGPTELIGCGQNGCTRQKGTPVQVKELGHIVLYVRNLERSAAFYRDVLGWKQLDGPAMGFPAAAFSSGRTHHELLLIEVGDGAQAIPEGRRVGLYH